MPYNERKTIRMMFLPCGWKSGHYERLRVLAFDLFLFPNCKAPFSEEIFNSKVDAWGFAELFTLFLAWSLYSALHSKCFSQIFTISSEYTSKVFIILFKECLGIFPLLCSISHLPSELIQIFALLSPTLLPIWT